MDIGLDVNQLYNSVEGRSSQVSNHDDALMSTFADVKSPKKKS